MNDILNFLLIKESWKKDGFQKTAAPLFWTMIILRNVSWAANQHIRKISEGSCDNEDWSNDAENSALIHFLLKYIKLENSSFKL